MIDLLCCERISIEDIKLVASISWLTPEKGGRKKHIPLKTEKYAP